MQAQTFVCVLAGLLVLSCTLQTTVAKSSPGKMKSMAEVLQILQNLDKYYSQAARPSPYSDMSEIQEAVHKIRLRELDRNYLQRTRPRSKRFYCRLRTAQTLSMPAFRSRSVAFGQSDIFFEFGKRTYPALDERLFNSEELPVEEPQPWERFIR